MCAMQSHSAHPNPPRAPSDTAGQSRADRLKNLLTARFAPERIDVVDDSARHAGHSGARAGGQTHYNVLVVAAAFRGMSRIERSRAVHSLLEGEFAGGLHALALTLRTPEEQQGG
jgi:stress-induced morphogen